MSVELTKIVEGIDRVCVYGAELRDTFLRIELYDAMRYYECILYIQYFILLDIRVIIYYNLSRTSNVYIR